MDRASELPSCHWRLNPAIDPHPSFTGSGRTSSFANPPAGRRSCRAVDSPAVHILFLAPTSFVGWLHDAFTGIQTTNGQSSERKPAMFNDESTPTVPESVPSTEPAAQTEPTAQMDQEPVSASEQSPAESQPEQPVEVAEEKSQAQAG